MEVVKILSFTRCVDRVLTALVVGQFAGVSEGS